MAERPFPSTAVLAAFGVTGSPIEALPGGEETSVLSGGVVLKFVRGDAVSPWSQSLLADLRPEGVLVPEPVSARDGAWTVDGWIASKFVDGLRPLQDDPGRVIAAGERLADAIADRPPDRVDVVRERADRWARADRCVWNEEVVQLSQPADELASVLRSRMGRDGREPAAVVHGDLSGNVFADPSDVPVVLDFTPIVRPRRFAAAIVVGDNLLWGGGSVELTTLIGDDDDALARALLFRLIAEQLADRPRHGARLGDYARVLQALGWMS